MNDIDYEIAYKEALNRAKLLKYNPKKVLIECENIPISDYIFPELRESEVERIIQWIRKELEDKYVTDNIVNNEIANKALAWLEKQGEQKSAETVKWSPQEESCICQLESLVKEQWRQAEKVHNSVNIKKMSELMFFLKTLNPNKKPQGKSALEAAKEEKIDNANKVEPKFKVGDIVQYITDSTDRRKIEEVDTFCNMYHTDSSPIMFEIEDEWKVVVNAEDVEQTPTDKTEPKFKVGDWIIYKEEGGVFLDGRKFAQITKIEGEKHWLDTAITYLKAEDMRLWTLEDAKDGDILYSKKHNLLWRYKNTKECYFCINLNYNSNNISKGDVIVIPNDVKPATKEQRDLLFQKMKEAGYEWNPETK